MVAGSLISTGGLLCFGRLSGDLRVAAWGVSASRSSQCCSLSLARGLLLYRLRRFLYASFVMITHAALMPTVYTIGHGRHPFAYFLSLLRRHEIALVCDVRSAARSRWPQYNGRVLAAALRENRIGYEHLPECGGKNPAPPAELARGLDRIIELAGDVRVAVMCSESQPLTRHAHARANCHRVGLLATPLRDRGARLIHILPDGETIELDESVLSSPW